MRTKKNPVAQVTGEIGERFDELTLDTEPVLPARGELALEAFIGHGTRERVYLRGRVRRGAGVGEVGEADSRWRNLANTFRRLLRKQLAGVAVTASFRGQELEAVSDRSGFVDFEIPVDPELEEEREWWEAELRATDPRNGRKVRTTTPVLIPTSAAEFGIISDIDDTVVRTEVTNWLRMLKIVLLTNAYTRTPFEHVETLYEALRAGPRGVGENPVFYVSSSPWSFYDLLEEFFRIHDLPDGPLFLKQYNVSLRHLRGSSHHNHKLVWIRFLLETHPQLPFVLVGDSGQEDPEIYREIVKEYPGRVLAILIRDVTSPTRDDQVHTIAREIAEMGVEMALVEDKLTAGEAAVRLGLIEEHWLHLMREEKAAALREE